MSFSNFIGREREGSFVAVPPLPPFSLPRSPWVQGLDSSKKNDADIENKRVSKIDIENKEVISIDIENKGLISLAQICFRAVIAMVDPEKAKGAAFAARCQSRKRDLFST